MPKRILMIAYHFPPIHVSSGLHRTLAFSRYLLDHGWRPIVLTCHPRAYVRTSDDQLKDIAEGVEVVRAFALDTSRHLAIAGRYPLRLALPDNWKTWRLGARRAARRILRDARPDVIWSTFPIATAHRIGLDFHERTGLPWIADFRDSMTEDDYPQPRRKWEWWRDLERRTVERCARSVFTTPGARRMYAERYPGIDDARWAVVANGFDEEAFAGAERVEPPARDTRTTLVHSGILYRSERDPRPFYAALGALKAAGETDGLRVILRASGDEAWHREQIEARGVADVVELAGPVPYRKALAEMTSVDGLLLFQASNCNHQIPAKVYEYLRARKPILALTDPAGDTAGLLRDAGAGRIVRLDSRDEIEKGLVAFLGELREGRGAVADDETIASLSREARTEEFARLLDAL